MYIAFQQSGFNNTTHILGPSMNNEYSLRSLHIPIYICHASPKVSCRSQLFVTSVKCETTIKTGEGHKENSRQNSLQVSNKQLRI